MHELMPQAVFTVAWPLQFGDEIFGVSVVGSAQPTVLGLCHPLVAEFGRHHELGNQPLIGLHPMI